MGTRSIYEAILIAKQKGERLRDIGVKALALAFYLKTGQLNHKKLERFLRNWATIGQLK